MRAYHQGPTYTVEFTSSDTACFARHTGADPSVVRGSGAFVFDSETGDLVESRGAPMKSDNIQWLAFSQDAQDVGRGLLLKQGVVANPYDWGTVLSSTIRHSNPAKGIIVEVSQDATGSVTLWPTSRKVRDRIEKHLNEFGERDASVFLQEHHGDTWIEDNLSADDAETVRQGWTVAIVVDPFDYGMWRGWDVHNVDMKGNPTFDAPEGTVSLKQLQYEAAGHLRSARSELRKAREEVATFRRFNREINRGRACVAAQNAHLYAERAWTLYELSGSKGKKPASNARAQARDMMVRLRCLPNEQAVYSALHNYKQMERMKQGGRTANPPRISRTRGVKTMRGPYDARRGYSPWIKRKGKLGQGFLTTMTTAERKKALDRCVKNYGYRSCLGSIMVLERARTGPRGEGVGVGVKYASKLKSAREYLVKTYGGPGSFGPRRQQLAAVAADSGTAGIEEYPGYFPMANPSNQLCCLEWTNEDPQVLIWRSRAGVGSKDYQIDLALLLRRLGKLGVSADYIAVQPSRTVNLPLRRRVIARYTTFPKSAAQAKGMRSRLGTLAAGVGRSQDARGGGNTTRTLLFMLERDLTTREAKQLDKRPTAKEKKEVHELLPLESWPTNYIRHKNPGEDLPELFKMNLLLDPGTVTSIMENHEGQGSDLYSLGSTANGGTVSQAMILAGIDELESQKESAGWQRKRQLNELIEQLDSVAAFPDENSAERAGIEEPKGGWRYSVWLMDRYELNPGPAAHRRLAMKLFGDSHRSLRLANTQMDRCMELIASGQGVTRGGRLNAAAKMRCNQACNFAGVAYRQAVAARQEARSIHGEAERAKLEQQIASVMKEATVALDAMGCPHTQERHLPRKAQQALESNPDGQTHLFEADRWLKSSKKLASRARVEPDLQRRCGYLWSAHRNAHRSLIEAKNAQRWLEDLDQKGAYRDLVHEATKVMDKAARELNKLRNTKHGHLVLCGAPRAEAISG